MQPAKPPRRKSTLPNLEVFKDRHGRTRYYYRVGKGPRTPIKGLYGSDEFMASYLDIVNDRVAPARPAIQRREPGRTVAALIADYKANNEQFKRNREGTTKKGYGSRLRAIERDYGDCPVSGLTRARILDFLEDFDDTPGSGIDTHKKFKILIKHAIEIGWMTGDPMIGIKRPAGGTIRPWTEDEVEQFKKRWPLGTRQHLAMTLTEYLGQRRSDTHRMNWSDINPRTGRIKVQQQKTGAKLEIPLHEDLLYILDDAHARRGVVTTISEPIIKTEAGVAFTVAGFSDWMRDAISAADLPLDCKPHGLRHLAGVRMAEAGCTDEEMMAVLGHKSVTSLRVYTKGANQRRLATAAILKLEQSGNKPSPNRPFQFGNLPKKSAKTGA